MGSSTTTVTDSSFATDVLGSSTPVLVDFWAEWCGPCRAIAPVLEEIAAAQAGRLTVAKLNVDENGATARAYNVMSIPTLILFKQGRPVGQIIGAKSKGALMREIESHL